ncbi:SMP-30/gluconolactonase/LRE family protein [Sporosarcina saromensis]|uniref:SMP-30/gluconolactonase/LRE family protein n=1 Tax=Sporosarcina saromensis TaxID=359365 RepID=A0ABU4G7Z2_9BACL|nr:SMP-30/gluconolactonase/LRE family protein [Sporosarcina saromensis]MDW0113089.1 SMP-30/gluconolactonase/LRE family protein [Sporosarcina saromensis]
MREAELFCEMQAALGEGPVFHTESNSLYWTDILKKQLHSFSLHEKRLTTIQTDKHIGAFSFVDEKTLVVAADNGFSFFDLEDATFTFITDPEEALPQNRFNDGKCDARGRFWAGTMEFKPTSPNGSLYRLDTTRNALKLESSIIISNGLAWNKDHTIMYHVDSGRNAIYEYNYDLETGTIHNRKLLYTFENDYGTPDGIAIDSNDCLYIALWGGAKVIYFNPTTCEILEEIVIPAPHVTSVTFGEKDFKTLYITTARDGLSSEQLEQYPLSGSVFKVDVPVAGIPLHPYQSCKGVIQSENCKL